MCGYNGILSIHYTIRYSLDCFVVHDFKYKWHRFAPRNSADGTTLPIHFVPIVVAFVSSVGTRFNHIPPLHCLWIREAFVNERHRLNFLVYQNSRRN